MQIAIVSDTHLPRGTRRLPDRCAELCRQADLIVHAGDFMRTEVLRQFERYGAVAAVHGNVDDHELNRLLPATTTVKLGDATLGVIHDAGPRHGRLERMRRGFPNTHAVVFGHSHIPLHERAEDGFQIFNPGSPTERRRSPHHTMGIATVEGSTIDFSLVILD